MKNTKYFKTALLQAALVITALFGTSSCSSGQQPKEPKHKTEKNNKANADSTSLSDTQFLSKAAEINQEEIGLGQLAQQTSTMPDVKALGKMMEDSHTKSMSDLTALAAKKSINITSSPENKTKGTYKKLSAKAGNEFDTKYCDLMVKRNKDAIALFEKVSTGSGDEEIKQWATASLSELHTGLDQAVICQKKYKKAK